MTAGRRWQRPAKARAAAARLRRALVRFAGDDAGSAAAIEFAIWVPAFVFILMFFLDLSLYFTTRTDLMRASRDAARSLAVGAMQPAGLDTFLTNRLGSRLVFTATLSGTETVTLDTSVPMAAATLFGMVHLLGQDSIDVHVVVRREITTEELETGIIGTLGTS